MLDNLPVVREAFPKTVRLVSTARLRPPVLAQLVPPEDLDALAEIEGATSQRLIAEQRGTAGFGRDEFVYGVPYASFINAAFAYAKPLEPNRFNAARGGMVCGARGRDLHARSCLAHGRFLGKIR